jgi:excisionase family DNA binding protein
MGGMAGDQDDASSVKGCRVTARATSGQPLRKSAAGHERESRLAKPCEAVPKLLLTPEEAADALGVGRTTVYELLRTGAITSVRIGSSRRIPTSSVQEYVRGLTSQQTAARAEEFDRSPAGAGAADRTADRRGHNRGRGAGAARPVRSDRQPTVEILPLPFIAGQDE